MEKIVFEIILHSGNAKSKLIKSMNLLKEFNFDESRRLQKEATEEIRKAHEVQTKLIQSEVRGDIEPVKLLMVHAQDHLSGAITVRDLLLEFTEIFYALDKRIKEVEK